MKIEWIPDYPLDDECIQAMEKAADQCLISEGIPFPCSITVRLCDDENIRRINALHRNINLSTDVLSFPSVAYPAGKTASACQHLLQKEYDDETSACFLGDIVISVPHCLAQANEFGHSKVRESAYLLVHGICHLMGYDHIKEVERLAMRKMEENILSSVSLERNMEDPATQTIQPDEELIAAAREAMKMSYSPYSRYPVGAAIRTEEGRIFTGCNIENASFGLTNCAERTAVFKAVSEGFHRFTAIAIAALHPSWPCGACRQVLNEFAPGITVWTTAEGYPVRMKKLTELLPESFGPKDLQ
ncbi:MAG: cytidine deaminase [Clostridia bacterium]|jgi:homotetrameric cytidine deaminase/rRNA maturation RNase YbeY|nr:cytidine deaminase [Clostridia bacterium]